MQGWGAGASRRQVFLAPWSRICLKKKTGAESWSRLEKRSGARAAKKLASSSALLEDKKQKEIVLLLLLFR